VPIFVELWITSGTPPVAALRKDLLFPARLLSDRARLRRTRSINMGVES
jgi:hypothetical protein